jgi:hypothetical protein
MTATEIVRFANYSRIRDGRAEPFEWRHPVPGWELVLYGPLVRETGYGVPTPTH